MTDVYMSDANSRLSFQLVSDMHLEMLGGMQAPDSVMPKAYAPILVMAGDICTAVRPDYKDVIRRVTSPFELTLYVPGNHEYYSEPHYGSVDMKVLDKKMQDECKSLRNIIWLNNRSVVLSGIGFVGTTLWTDVAASSWASADQCLNDYNLIFDCGKKVSPALFTYGHRILRDRLVKNIDKVIKEGAEKVVVVTHHVPDIALAKKNLNPQLNPFYYCTDMGPILSNPKNKITVWCYGHTHESMVTRLRPLNTMFATNAIGYPDEKTGYGPGLIRI
jgi:predicted phosphohydrolase